MPFFVLSYGFELIFSFLFHIHIDIYHYIIEIFSIWCYIIKKCGVDIVGIAVELVARIDDLSSTIDSVVSAIDARGYTFSDAGGELRISVCELGDIIFSVVRDEDDNLMAYASATTNIVGAGFHKEVCDFFDEIKHLFSNCTITDETDYIEHKNFQLLKDEHFNKYLHNLIKIAVENDNEQNGQMMFCWDIGDYSPETIENSVVTPFGRYSIRHLEHIIKNHKIDLFAKEFFIWNEIEKDARFYRNSALHLMWHSLHYIKDFGVIESEKLLHEKVVSMLEKSASMDNKLPFPKQEYLEICKLHDHTPIDVSALPEYSSEYPIGYRKDTICHNIGIINVAVNGNLLFEQQDDTSVWYNTDEECFNMRVFAYTTGDKLAEVKRDIAENEACIEEFSIGDGICCVAYTGKEDPEDEASVHITVANIACANQLTVVIFAHSKKDDYNKAIKYLKMFSTNSSSE